MFPEPQCVLSKNKEHKRAVKMEKKRLKIVLAVLNALRSRFTETNEFIDNTLKEECEKESITVDEVIYFCF